MMANHSEFAIAILAIYGGMPRLFSAAFKVLPNIWNRRAGY